MMRTFAAFVVLALAAGPLAAQSCSTLTVTGSIAPGQTITIDVAGSLPDAVTFLAAGETAGSTSFSFGSLGGFTLDLDFPFILVPLGVTDANGAVGVSFTVPSAIPPGTIPSISLTLQAVSLSLSFGMGPPTLATCVSNTASLTS